MRNYGYDDAVFGPCLHSFEICQQSPSFPLWKLSAVILRVHDTHWVGGPLVAARMWRVVFARKQYLLFVCWTVRPKCGHENADEKRLVRLAALQQNPINFKKTQRTVHLVNQERFKIVKGKQCWNLLHQWKPGENITLEIISRWTLEPLAGLAVVKGNLETSRLRVFCSRQCNSHFL